MVALGAAASLNMKTRVKKRKMTRMISGAAHGVNRKTNISMCNEREIQNEMSYLL